MSEDKLLSDRVRAHFVTTGDTKVSVVQKDMWADEIAALEGEIQRQGLFLRHIEAETQKGIRKQIIDTDICWYIGQWKKKMPENL